MQQPLKLNDFVRPLDPHATISLSDFVTIAEAHKGLFTVNGIDYDDILYCGTDNLYFSYCFNANSGRAVAENLLIVDSISEYDSHYVITSQGKEYSVFLKE